MNAASELTTLTNKYGHAAIIEALLASLQWNLKWASPEELSLARPAIEGLQQAYDRLSALEKDEEEMRKR